MRRPSFTNRKLVALALLAGAGGACSEEPSDTTGQEEYIQQIQAELDAAAVANPNSANSFKPVKPVLKCVAKTGSNTYAAHFGYTNSSSSSISIPVGFFNRFWPPPISKGQPTTFAPGTQADVVTVPFSGFSASIWVLGNHFAVATKFSKVCPAGGTGGMGTGGSIGTGGSGTGGSGTGGRGTGGMGTGGLGTGGMGVGGMGTGGIIVGTGGMGVGGMGTGGMGTGGTIVGTGGMGTGGMGTGGMGTGGTGTGGVCGAAPTTCDDLNPCTIDSVGSDPNTGCPICVHIAALDGGTCSDGNACTVGDTCQAGACVGGAPKACTALDQCHVAGACDTTTGACSNPAAPDGRLCNDNNACTTGDICVSGICTMGAPILCNAPDACHTAGVCDHTTGACSNPSAPDGTTCNDGNACTSGDACRIGVCTGGTPTVCAPSDQCHIAGVCNPANGTCSNPAAPNGVTCSDNNACTTGDVCTNGTCTPGTAKTCAATDSCHGAGTCDPASGTCSNPPLANGTVCTDNNACTTGDVCTAGVCTPGTPVVCTGGGGACQVAGTCNPMTGLCGGGNLPDGTACNDLDSCTTGDACLAGVCTPSMTLEPTKCAGEACNQCSFGGAPVTPPVNTNLCNTSPEGCFNCVIDTDGCDVFGADTGPTSDRFLCENLYKCLVAPLHPGTSIPTFCTQGGDPSRCWCGTNLTGCTTDNPPAATAANGPCLQQVFAAGKSMDAATINQRFIDPAFPLGRAVNLAACQSNFCPGECSVHP